MINKLFLENSKEITAGATSQTKDIDMEQFTKLTVLVAADTAHTFGAKIVWSKDVAGDDAPEDTAILSASQTVALSSVIDGKSSIATIEITNGDSADHTYDVYIYRIAG